MVQNERMKGIIASSLLLYLYFLFFFFSFPSDVSFRITYIYIYGYLEHAKWNLMPFSNLSLGWSRQLLRGGRGACAAGEIYIFEGIFVLTPSPFPSLYALCPVCTRHTVSRTLFAISISRGFSIACSFLEFLFLYNLNEKFVSTTRFDAVLSTTTRVSSLNTVYLILIDAFNARTRGKRSNYRFEITDYPRK